jgi:hypothetical protein
MNIPADVRFFGGTPHLAMVPTTHISYTPENSKRCECLKGCHFMARLVLAPGNDSFPQTVSSVRDQAS